MKSLILLNYQENTKQVEEEEKVKFLREILANIGVPVEDFWNDELILSIEQRKKLRQTLTTYAIQVVDDRDGGLRIYVDNEKIAEWQKPVYKLKQSLQEVDPKKKIFIEMTVECWSLFEEANT